MNFTRCELGQPWQAEQSDFSIRILVGTALSVAILASALAPVPPSLPAVTFEQAGLYRLEVALLVFYGWLLLITPAFSGLIRGRLPIEISTRGAKFAEGGERSTELDEAETRELAGTIADLVEALADTRIEIERLSTTARSDSRQQEVGSDHD